MKKDWVNKYRKALVAEPTLENIYNLKLLAFEVLGFNLKYNLNNNRVEFYKNEVKIYDVFYDIKAKDVESAIASFLLSEIPLYISEKNFLYTESTLNKLKKLSEKEYYFFLDICLTLLHNVYFVFIESNKENLIFILPAFYRFTHFLNKETEIYNILALIAEAENNHEKAIFFSKLALENCHSDEHEYLTLLQILWTKMIDAGQIKDAIDLLLSVYPKITIENKAEFEELFHSTYEIIKHHSHA